MAILLGERVITPGTKTDPVLDETPDTLSISGPAQDRSITVIENPEVGGFYGYLFAGQLVQKPHATVFREAAYFRVEAAGMRIFDQQDLDQVETKKGFNPGEHLNYDFLVANGRMVLPRPSEVPYQICFVESETYEMWLHSLRQTKEPKAVLTVINTVLGQKVDKFRLDSNNGLVLPHNYASLSLNGTRIPPNLRTT